MIEATVAWDGVPTDPDRAGWHLLRRVRPDWAAGEEDVFHHDRSRALPWMRQENGVRHSWRETLQGELAWNWIYVGRLEIVP